MVRRSFVPPPPRPLRGLVPLVPIPSVRLLVCAVAALAGALGVRAQAPLTLVNDDTQVRRLQFDQTDGAELEPAQLELQIATTAPGFLERLPIVRYAVSKGVYPFSPVELARDVVRLQRYYVRNGFPRAAVDYAVELDTTRNVVDVTFEIEHGPPLLLDEVTFRAPGAPSVAEALAPDLAEEWAEFSRRTALRRGDRLDDFGLVDLQSRTLGWLRNAGYAFADAGVERFVDSTGLAAEVRIKVIPGTRATFGAITVEGAEGLPESIITRELPFHTGDQFSAAALTEGQREIFGLGLFTLALVNIDSSAVRGSPTVPIKVRVRRGPVRVLSGFGGYYSDGGVTVRGQVGHRNFLGGARQLTLGGEARTGILGAAGQSVTGDPIRDLRASLSLRQPYVFDRRLSLTVTPSVRDRRDEIEASRQAELSTTLLYTRSALRTVAVSATGRYRDLSQGQGLRLLDATGLFVTNALTARTGILSADATWGAIDSPLSPRRGAIVRPSLATALGDVQYGRARLSATVLRPFGRRSGVVARVTAGTLLASRAAVDTPRDYVLLRDQLFYAGGTADVRGWAGARLGPKTLSIVPVNGTQLSGPGDVAYVGVGGTAKVSASLQVNLPLPIGPQWGANVFLDGGRVWAPSTVPSTALLRSTGNVTDASFATVLDQEGGFRVGTGAGLQFLTPVGFISFGIGVKLNPSLLDLRTPGDVLCGNAFSTSTPVCTGGYVGARLAGQPFGPTEVQAIDPDRWFFGVFPQRGRIAFHFTIGQTF